jgi:hypothetical protein
MFYAAASLAHFAHNAEFLADYPNLPVWLTRGQVYLTWCSIQAIGVLGYLLTRGKYELLGFGVLGIYAAIGFDGLLHYSRAPVAAHTATMNFTIWFEVVAAVSVLCAIAALLGERFHESKRDA